MASDYVKQHYRFWFSSIRDAPPYTRLLFMAMWNLCDERGIVEATAGALAAFANLPLKDVQDSLALLAAPDPNSTSAECGGARIVSLGPNRWHVVNFERYRDENASIDRRTYWKEKKREQRDKQKQNVPVDISTNVPETTQDMSNNVPETMSPLDKQRKYWRERKAKLRSVQKSETNRDGPGLSPNVPIIRIRAHSEENVPSGLNENEKDPEREGYASSVSKQVPRLRRRGKAKKGKSLSTSFQPGADRNGEPDEGGKIEAFLTSPEFKEKRAEVQTKGLERVDPLADPVVAKAVKKVGFKP